MLIILCALITAVVLLALVIAVLSMNIRNLTAKLEGINDQMSSLTRSHLYLQGILKKMVENREIIDPLEFSYFISGLHVNRYQAIQSEQFEIIKHIDKVINSSMERFSKNNPESELIIVRSVNYEQDDDNEDK